MGRKASAEPAQAEPSTQKSTRKKPVKKSRARAARVTKVAEQAKPRARRKAKKESAKEAQAGIEDKRDDYPPAIFVDRIIRQFQARLGADAKATVADYIRLLQLRRELEEQEDAPKEITVTWVDPPSDGPEEEA
jgi:hypothetical protein